ncbi:hypothetical protein, partial [Leptobacterium sp. I13]|uniref:hypothetical protein n=1 Tax=Leptobacterium meishanense TaxID=3128904 RepID=UPI0030EE5EE8
MGVFSEGAGRRREGHRVKKEIYNTSGSLTRTDYYVRDVAEGGAYKKCLVDIFSERARLPHWMLAIYNNSTLTEHAIYGSGRLG